MYLSDAEVKALAAKVLCWVSNSVTLCYMSCQMTNRQHKCYRIRGYTAMDDRLTRGVPVIQINHLSGSSLVRQTSMAV
jgi:hypothetical protein